jgi:hypothetical protein
VSSRLKAASRFALKHLAISVLIAVLCAALVFGVWYPFPYSQLAGGRELFLLVVTVDVTMGPLLSLVVYSPAKPKSELWRDIGFIALAQLMALAYGLYSVAEARPVWLAFEGDRFRIVAIPDIDRAKLPDAPAHLRPLSYTGPKLIGVKLIGSDDPGFLKSLEEAIQGNHPAFRPGRWTDFESQRQTVAQTSRPVSELTGRMRDKADGLNAQIAKCGGSEADIGYLPLLSQKLEDWVVLLNRRSGQPCGYLLVDGP